MKFYFAIFYCLSLCLSSAAKKLVSIQATQSDAVVWADGDSFPVDYIHPDTNEKTTSVFRLYYVDCPESVAVRDSDLNRLTEQQRYFALPDRKIVIEFGKKASIRTRELLSKPFTIHTAFASAGGRSGKPRHYAMITLHDNRDLAAVLVEEGLARAKGVSRKMPSGVSAKDYSEALADKELVAAIDKRGIWDSSNTKELVIMRQEARKAKAEAAKLINQANNIPVIDAANPLDINSASKEALKSIKGIGEATAHKIILNRPFKSLEELYQLENIHKNQIDSYIHLLYIPEEPEAK